MVLRGRPDRTRIPVIEHVREGTEALNSHPTDSLDRRTRGAGHGVDHLTLIRQLRLVVTETSAGQGYAYVDHGVALLAASDKRTASRLLWEAIASSEGDVVSGHITPENSWAVDVGLAARLELHLDGFAGLRHMKPPAPDLPHGARCSRDRLRSCWAALLRWPHDDGRPAPRSRSDAGSSPSAERGVSCPGRPAGAVRPELVERARAAKAALGGRVFCSGTTTSATR